MNNEQITVKISASGTTARKIKHLDLPLISPQEWEEIYSKEENLLEEYEIESIVHTETIDQYGQVNILHLPVGGQIVCNPKGTYLAEVLPNGKIEIL